MNSDIANAHATGTASQPAVTPPERARFWAQPHPEPILDAARVSLDDFRRAQPTWKAYGKYVWLRAVRPILFALFWAGVLIYVWRHFFMSTGELGDVSLLALYAVIVLAILLGMLLLAPVRRVLLAAEEGEAGDPLDDTRPEVADFARMAPRRLSLWRHTRSLRIRHDRKGRLRNAEAGEAAVPGAATAAVDQAA